jgi:hypothetical protein
MKLPRDLSGAALIKLLVKYYGYRRVNAVLRAVADFQGVDREEILKHL